jgi:hypothetical protein
MGLNYDGQTRRNETIAIDGGSFVRTVFDNCILTYDGGGVPNLERCEMRGTTHLALGEAALATMSFFVLLNMWSPSTAKQLYEGTQTMLKEMSNPSTRQ